MEEIIKIEVKNDNLEQALRVLKKKLQREGTFRLLKLKSHFEKPSEKKKREKEENKVEKREAKVREAKVREVKEREAKEIETKEREAKEKEER